VNFIFLPFLMAFFTLLLSLQSIWYRYVIPAAQCRV
jgi:hypothetical protein